MVLSGTSITATIVGPGVSLTTLSATDSYLQTQTKWGILDFLYSGGTGTLIDNLIVHA